ncbi:MAG: GNAT family N-acetyltransferase [Clostridiales Family XIII bacterium]|nr:GNAT family N-acetyltransferase [Clostridiales Family XIII bacterium]
MDIRAATSIDVPSIDACVTEAFKDYIPLIGKKPAPMLADYGAIIEKHFAFVAVADGLVAGVLTICDTRDDFMWMDVLAVFKKYRGLGIGKKLIEYAESFIAGKGKSECRIYTNVKFEKTIAVYRHLGYVEYQRMHEDGYDRMFFRKNVSMNKCKSNGVEHELL